MTAVWRNIHRTILWCSLAILIPKDPEIPGKTVALGGVDQIPYLHLFVTIHVWSVLCISYPCAKYFCSCSTSVNDIKSTVEIGISQVFRVCHHFIYNTIIGNDIVYLILARCLTSKHVQVLVD